MSEDTQNNTEAVEEKVESPAADTGLKLNTVYAFKEGMSSLVNDNGDMLPVTVCRFEPWIVSQVKYEAKDGYDAVQLACRPHRASRGSKAKQGHFKAAGFENGAMFARELKNPPAGIEIGQKLDIDSLAVGDKVKVRGTSKGKGFAGAVKRFGVGGGPATHGSGFNRAPGSAGMNKEPGRIMPGKKMPGHMGDETVTVVSEVVEILRDENVVILKGAIPGSRTSLVQITKV